VVSWSRPFIDGVAVPSLAAAAAQLPFRPSLATAIGAPVSIFVHGDVGGRQAEQALGLVFDSPSTGRFLVIEEPTQSTEAELEQAAATCDPANGCEGVWRMVDLADGTPALEIAGAVSTGFIWIRSGVRYDVFGPAATFTPAKAREIADAFAAAAG